MFWKRAQLKKTIKNIPFQKIDPAFSECDHCVVFCADDGYMALTAVAIQSIVDHVVPEEYYDILVFHGGISAEHETIYQDQWKEYQNVSIRLVNIAPLFDGLDLYTENRENFTREAYFRLVTPWVLSERYTTALYLDGDMILRYDLSPIFDTRLNDNLLAAVKDYWGICNCYMENDPRREYRLSIGLDDIDHYVISATLLFNLAAWREHFSLEEVIRLCASKKWEQHDQDVVNVLCQGRIVFLSPTWGMMEDYGNNHFLPQNMQKELAEVSDNPIIAHFGNIRKPYLRNYVKFDVEFWNYADRTTCLKELLGRIESDEYRTYVVYTINPSAIESINNVNREELCYKGVLLGEKNLAHQKYKVMRISSQKLHVEASVGYFGLKQNDKVDIGIIVEGKRISAIDIHNETIINSKLRKVYCGYVAIFDVPLGLVKIRSDIRLESRINGKISPLSTIVFQQYAEVSGKFRNDYYSHEGWTLSRAADDKGIIIEKNKIGSICLHEGRLLWEVFWARGVLGGKKAVVLRLIAHFCRFFVKKPIWLISDRMDRADDNGEVFFNYMKSNHEKEIKVFFLLLPSSKDYSRMKEIGNIIVPYSWTHKLLALLAEWSISSQTDYIYRDPFRDYGHPYRDMLRKTRFVFLQHGIISNDVSRWLDKDRQELDGFITSTRKEYESIINGNYHYKKEQVWLTGLARFDRLSDHREKVITIMPTWRQYLFTEQDHRTGEWTLKKNFYNSEYASFYRNLMNNRILKNMSQRLGYRIQFKAHPTCAIYINEFGFDKDVIIVSEETSYADIYSQSSLVVTDYSSSIYDFVYMRKPVIYTQFDADVFFSGNHICDKGYFDYERDGFGEVVYSVEETVNLMIQYMENDCMLHEPYRSRIESIFEESKANHCKQIYEKIISQGKY